MRPTTISSPAGSIATPVAQSDCFSSVARIVISCGIPDLDQPVFAGGDERLAIGGPGQAEDGRFVGELRLEQRVRSFLGRLAHLPDADAVIDARRGDARPIRAERQRIQLLERFLERIQPRAGSDVPQLHGPVAAGAGQHFAVLAERQLIDRAVVAFQRFRLPSHPPCSRA